jgi:hypothetical protein
VVVHTLVMTGSLGGGAHTGDDRRIVIFDVFKKKCRTALFLIELGDMRQFQIPIDFSGDAFAQTCFFAFGDKIPHTFHEIIPPFLNRKSIIYV